MGLTPVYSWPYPELNNPPDGATQMKNLALAIEPTVKTNADNVAAIGTGSFGAFTPYTPAGGLAGVTIGNGSYNVNYRRIGGLVWIQLNINAAASGVTTVFAAGNLMMKLPFTSNNYYTNGAAYWAPGGGGAYKAGLCSLSAPDTFIVFALRQTDAAYAAPSAVWGTAAWGTNANLNATLVYSTTGAVPA
jgi:hypothetical protein